MLLKLYGFRGTTLIIGGCALHSVVGSCLLRPLQERLSIPSIAPVEVIILIYKIYRKFVYIRHIGISIVQFT